MRRALLTLILLMPMTSHAESYELLYEEQEPGVEPYTSRILVTDRYLRIDDLSDDSGFILYDDELETVYSVSHHNRSTLVIRSGNYERPDLKDSVVISDSELEDAPSISGRTVRDHTVRQIDNDELCTRVQYVPGLLEEVGEMMHAYQTSLVANQVRTLEGTPPEYRTPCMVSDQVYFDGAIYRKGIPVSESRHNGRKRLLRSYRKSEVDAGMFELPEYGQFSLD